MAWTAPITFTAGSTLTASTLNTYLKTNMDEMAPAKVTTLGSHFVASGANALVERVAVTSRADALVTTTSTTYVTLGSSTPSVSVTTGTKALVLIGASMETQDVNNINALVSFAVSGATTQAAADNRSYAMDGVTAGTNVNRMQGGVMDFVSNLTAGSNTFTMQYRTGSATSTARFQFRIITVIPF